jgi:hypothetical protein
MALYGDNFERILNLKSNSISCFNEISKKEMSFKNMKPQFPKQSKKSRRYSLASTSELKFLFSKNEKKNSNVSANLDLSKAFHPESLNLLDIREPRLYVPDILKGAPILIMNKNKNINQNVFEKNNKNKKYNKTESKLKSYISSQPKAFKSAGSHTQRYFSKSAIFIHKTGSSKNSKLENIDKNKELNVCSELLKTIEKDVKKNKGKY